MSELTIRWQIYSSTEGYSLVRTGLALALCIETILLLIILYVIIKTM